MKVMLTLAVTSVILAGNSVYAQNDPVVPDGSAPKIYFSAKAQQFTQADGTFLTIDGKDAWVIDNGHKITAASGDHELADGRTITVKDGKVVGRLPEKGVLLFPPGQSNN